MESLDVVFDLQLILESLNSFRVFVLGRKHTDWDRNAFCIVRIDHSWVNCCDSFERCSGLRSKGHDLGRPQSACSVRGRVDTKAPCRTLPPQHIPNPPHVLILPPVLSSISFTTFGIFSAVFGGAAGPWKKAPSSLSECARMSAPWSVCSQKPKMS